MMFQCRKSDFMASRTIFDLTSIGGVPLNLLP